jgi:hypothetical protein
MGNRSWGSWSVIGPQESMTTARAAWGAVEAAGAVDDQADDVVEAFGAAVVDASAAKTRPS